MAPFKNRAWLFYDKMVLLVPNAAADGEMTFSAVVDPPLNQGYTAGSPVFPSDDSPFDTTQHLPDINVDELLQVGRDMFSTTDFSLQSGAVDTAISTLQEVIPPSAHMRSRSSGGQQTLSTDASSPYPCPPSSRTSLKLSKGKSMHTPAGSLSRKSSSLAPSIPGSKRSRVSKAKSSMASAVALNGVVGILSRATDVMSGLVDPPTEHCDHCDHKSNIVREASAMLNKDTHLLTAEIHGKLAYAFVKDKDLCQVYVELTDPELQKMFVHNWYQEKYGQLLPGPSSTSFSRPDIYIGQSGGGNVFYTGQSSSQLLPEPPNFFSGTQAVQSGSDYIVESSHSGPVQSDELNFSHPSFYNDEVLYDQSYNYSM